jgi:hypothetical protein
LNFINLLSERPIPWHLQRPLATRPSDAKRELSFMNAVRQLDSGNGDRGIVEMKRVFLPAREAFPA